jgi:hypothetical protein
MASFGSHPEATPPLCDFWICQTPLFLKHLFSLGFSAFTLSVPNRVSWQVLLMSHACLSTSDPPHSLDPNYISPTPMLGPPFGLLVPSTSYILDSLCPGPPFGLLVPSTSSNIMVHTWHCS